MNEVQTPQSTRPKTGERRPYQRPTVTPVGMWGPQVIALSLPGGARFPGISDNDPQN
ncbi:hypothetical protein [Deinococcus hopiensis]|uniref:Uncharacterized protein n=1 Tax=Deinococcus hopiensis KR-140 TaxID=695939 RepID=A0A1W1UYB5_9DEIO|nr:hypothetical protein [Deinococcus hopiensis]SMB86083.1 hypothetical protein SAMN00790413_03678 [Deinococcus hopiensis KR-140]